MRLINLNWKRQAGMSLVEAIVALLILAVMGSSITLLLVQISSANNTAKLRNQASSYVDQALEKVRSFDQKNGWVNLSLKGSSSGICYVDGTLVSVGSCIPAGSAPATCGIAVGNPVSGPFYAASYAMSVKSLLTVIKSRP